MSFYQSLMAQTTADGVPPTYAWSFRDAAFWLILLIVVAVAFFSQRYSKDALKAGGWYEGLSKPDWTPSKWVFPVVWSILYLLIAYSTYVAYRGSCGNKRTALALTFAIQLGLNFYWSYVFFKEKDLKKALYVILALLAAAGAQFYVMWGIDQFAASLFLPYIIWLFVAFLLNWRLSQMNSQPAVRIEKKEL